MSWIVAAITLALCPIAAIRWLRVAQREHYHAGSVLRFADRWWTSTPANTALFTVMGVAVLTWLLLIFLTSWAIIAGLIAGLIALVGPIGLGLRGRTSKLHWTRRLKTTAAVLGGLDVIVVAVARDPIVLAAQPVLLDVALAITAPLERRAAQKYVRSARAKLEAVKPITVAITGSYGKTSTKQYVRHLVSGSRHVLASPASFNNTNGLARTLNEQLAAGTEVFIAEMGTYGPGEIAAMCAWVQPRIAAIVNIGPVHLERMKSLDGIVAAKSEIGAGARQVVLNVDAYGLAAVADRFAAEGKEVLRCSTRDRAADVVVDASTRAVLIRGTSIGVVAEGPQPENVACAVAVVFALGVPADAIARRLNDLPAPEHRHEMSTSASGVVVIDNTFSSNPASAAASLAKLAAAARPGRRAVVVTPGMVEVGREQASANAQFARDAGAVATDFVVVGHTNRAALVAGARGQRGLHVHLVNNRDAAVAWVRAHLSSGDAVLYENDLPDHYP